MRPPVNLTRGPRGGRPRWTFLHPKQMEVYQSPARFRTVVAGRRWGKTQLSKTEMIKEARKPKRLIWYIAPTYQMARQIMWNDLTDSIPRKWIVKINETQMSVRLKNGSIIQLKGADKPDTLRGVGLHLVVLDEFQDMRPETWNTVIQPTLASTRGRAIFIGTPKSFNHLYDSYMRGQSATDTSWQSWQFKTITSPFILPEEIEEARRNMSEKEFQQEFEACHLPDTEIRLWDGRVKQIRDVKEDDVVPYIDENGERLPCSVLRVGETGVKRIVKVTLENGDVFEASDHHKMKVHAA